MKRKNCSISENTPAAVPRRHLRRQPGRPAARHRPQPQLPRLLGRRRREPELVERHLPRRRPRQRARESTRCASSSRERAVTMMICNHTYSNLVLRPPAIAATGKAPDEPRSRRSATRWRRRTATPARRRTSSTTPPARPRTGATGSPAASATPSRSATTGFHPAYEDAVVGEYLGEAPAAGAGLGGNREAYLARRGGRVAADVPLAGSAGTAPAGRTITVCKTHRLADLAGDPARRHDRRPDPLRGHPGHRLRLRRAAGSPSTSTRRRGRWSRVATAALPEAPPAGRDRADQPRRACRRWGRASPRPSRSRGPARRRQRLRHGLGRLAVDDAEAYDWDFTSLGPDGAAGRLRRDARQPRDHPHARPRRPGRTRWWPTTTPAATPPTTGPARSPSRAPSPPSTSGIKEAWLVSCTNRGGEVFGTREVVVDRGQVVGVGDLCRRASYKS